MLRRDVHYETGFVLKETTVRGKRRLFGATLVKVDQHFPYRFLNTVPAYVKTGPALFYSHYKSREFSSFQFVSEIVTSLYLFKANPPHKHDKNKDICPLPIFYCDKFVQRIV